MKVVSREEILRMQAEAKAAKRVVNFVEGSEIEKDLHNEAAKTVIADLQDSELMNQALLDEIGTRMLEETNGMFVNEIVKAGIVEKFEARGYETWKAEIAAVAEMKAKTEKGNAGFGDAVFAAAQEVEANQYIAGKQRAYAIDHENGIEEFGEIPMGMASAFKNEKEMMNALSQPINIKPSKVASLDVDNFLSLEIANSSRYTMKTNAKAEATLASVNAYVAANPIGQTADWNPDTVNAVKSATHGNDEVGVLSGKAGAPDPIVVHEMKGYKELS